MAILRSGSLTELIISILGLVTPLFIVYGFLYVTGNDMDSQLSAITYNLFGKDAHYSIPGLTLGVLDHCRVNRSDKRDTSFIGYQYKKNKVA